MPRPPIYSLTKYQREALALEWAQRRGYPIPKKPGGPFLILLIVIGFLAGGFPGLLLLIWLFFRDRDYRKQKDDLVMRWADWYERRS